MVCHCTGKGVNCMDGWIIGWMVGLMDRKFDGWMNSWLDNQKD